MKTYAKTFSAALALTAILVSVSCGAAPDGPGADAGSGSQGPGVTPPPAQTPLPEPTVQYSFFEPKTEEALKAVYSNGEYTGMEIANYGYMIAKTKADFDPAAFAKHGVDVVGSMSAAGVRYWYLHKESGLVETMKQAGKMAGLLYIEPDTMNYATAAFEYDNPDQHVASGIQYGVLTTMTKKAWEDYGFGPNRPVVANIDTGVRWAHPDLPGVVKHAYSWYSTGTGTANVLLTDIGFLNPLSDPEPPDRMVDGSNLATGTDGNGTAGGHGTHTTGTIAAVGNNGVGLAGMCWQVDLVSYKGLSDQGQGANWAVFGSLWHLAKWKNQVVTKVGADGEEYREARYPHTIPVNYSLGSGAPSHFAADMIETALEHGIVLICASGNDNSGFASWPGSYTGAIRVGAVNHLDKRWHYSNWGPDLSVMAPGVRVYSANRLNTYSYMDGTSMACPHVTGLAAYMLTFAPDLRPDQIKTYIERNADPLYDQKGRTNHTGWGRINTHRTIGAVIADLEAGSVQSDYVLSPVKVTVKDPAGAAINGAKVWLYNCNESGTIENYVSVLPTDYSYVGLRDDPAAAPEPGVVRFNMLREGKYRVVATMDIFDTEKREFVPHASASDAFGVRPGEAVEPIALTIGDEGTLFIQTYPTRNAARMSGDPIIRVYDSLTADAPLLDFDGPGYDTVAMTRPKPGTYWIQIIAYATAVGEYALWVGDLAKPSPANGRFNDPGADGVVGGQGTTRANAQPIGINDKIVYGDMVVANRTTGDWYRIVVP